MKIIGEVIAHIGIAEVAIDFVRFKREAERLRAARVTTYCERAEPGNGTGLGPEKTQDEPCWKGRDNDGDTSVLTVSVENWCAGCADRQSVHVRYREAVKQRGIAMRRLVLRVDKLTKPSTSATVIESPLASVASVVASPEPIEVEDDMPL